MPNRRTTIMSPCEYSLHVKEKDTRESYVKSAPDYRGDNVFLRTTEDNLLGLSVEDRQFLGFLQKELVKDDEGFWSAPLPFKPSRPVLPNNRIQAWRRAQILDVSLKRDSM